MFVEFRDEATSIGDRSALTKISEPKNGKFSRTLLKKGGGKISTGKMRVKE
jgi:hypothetical protein